MVFCAVLAEKPTQKTQQVASEKPVKVTQQKPTEQKQPPLSGGRPESTAVQQARATGKSVVPASPKNKTAVDLSDAFCLTISVATMTLYEQREDGTTFDELRDFYQSKGRKDGWAGYEYRIGYRGLLYAFEFNLGRDPGEVLSEAYEGCMVTTDDANFLELRELYYKHNPQ